MPLSVDPTGTNAFCVSPQCPISITRTTLRWLLTIALAAILIPINLAAACDSCDNAECNCASQPNSWVEMGCTSTDTLDLTVGSDSMPGVMSDCQCGACNSKRFANQFRDPRSGCEGYRPQWLATARALAFTRVTASPGVLISDSANPIEQINRDDLKFGWKPGIDLSLRRITWAENSFELRFIGLDPLIATATSSAGGTAELHATPPVFVSDITSIDATCESNLYGFEANWQFVTFCPFQYIAGIRYISLNEQFDVQLASPTTPVTYRTNTRNDLYGVQVGVTSIPEMPLFDCPWLTWSAKIGLYGNDAEQTSILTGTVGQRADSPADTAAFAGEFNIGIETPLTHCISISGGYTLFILERVAIATDQLQATNFFTATGSNHEGNAVFHGGSVALTLHF